MPNLETVVIEIPPELERMNGKEVWQEIQRALPEAFQPLLGVLEEGAPVGKTGKLRQAGFGLRMTAVSAGLINGVKVLVGSGDPVAHLVAEGHEIVPRGPGRDSIDQAPRGKKRQRRAELRASLKARREAGAIGFVPGNPWVEDAFESQRAEIIASLEAQLRRTFGQ
jgi:hypothetical protein